MADKSQPDSPASIAAVGFALAPYIVGVERGWMTRMNAIEAPATNVMSTHALVTNAQLKPRADLRVTAADDVVFLFDADNTLLDNDRIVADFDDHLQREFGLESRDRYWTIFEALRVELKSVLFAIKCSIRIKQRRIALLISHLSAPCQSDRRTMMRFDRSARRFLALVRGRISAGDVNERTESTWRPE